MQHRALAGVALALLACMATFMVVSYTAETPMLEEVEMTADMLKAKAKAKQEKGYALGMGKTDTLHNLINLKSYCVGTWDSARIALRRAKHGKYGAIIEFIVKYGQEGSGIDQGGRKAKSGMNIVSEYAQILGRLHAKFKSGINRYVLDEFNQHVVHGNGALYLKSNIRTMLGNLGGQLIVLRFKAFGLTSRPALLAELALKLPRYLLTRGHISKTFKGADAYAAAALLQSKYGGHYTSFYQRELNKVQRRMRQQFDVVAKAAYGAEAASFEAAYRANRKAFFEHLRVQSKAGRDAAVKKSAALAWRPPSLKVIKARAAKAAAAWLKKYQHLVKKGGAAKLIEEIADETSGVKLYITTSDVLNAQSAMRPKITFIGKKGSITGRIRAVGARGVTTVQHFATEKAIGKLKQVIIDNTAGKADESWTCSHLRLRVGGKNQRVISMMDKYSHQFTVKKNKVELHVNKSLKKRVRYVKPGCVKFQATNGCSWKGKHSRSDDKTCTQEIDGNLSGFCKCDQGPMMKVNCGHDTFTCDEMCQQ
jgi:hypothetical protein